MELSNEFTRYIIWACAIAAGALLAAVDRNAIGRPVFAGTLIAGIAGGLLLTELSPFSFGSSSYYMHGVIVAGGAALALLGYIPTRIALFFAGRRK